MAINITRYDPRFWLRIIFSKVSRGVMKKIMPSLIFIATYTFCICLLFDLLDWQGNDTLKNISSVYSILGFVISLLLAFRTNTSYDRWWEGRKALGSLSNTCRIIAVRLVACIKEESIRKYLITILSSFLIALKNHLRNQPDYENIDSSLSLKLEKKNIHLPLHILYRLNTSIESLRKENKISPEVYSATLTDIRELFNVLGVCERIKSTPIPYSYNTFIKEFIFIYTFTLPFAWVINFGYYTILAVVFVFYVLVTIELLADEIENPFGTDLNDLPFDDICRSIQKQITELTEYK